MDSGKWENEDEYYCTRLSFNNKLIEKLYFLSILEEDMNSEFPTHTFFIFAAKNKKNIIKEALNCFDYDHNYSGECKTCEKNSDNTECRKNFINKFKTKDIVNLTGDTTYYHFEIWTLKVKD